MHSVKCGAERAGSISTVIMIIKHKGQLSQRITLIDVGEG